MKNNWETHWKDYYQILQVHPTAEQEVIKAAYNRLARKYHPDVNKEPSSTKRMENINEAFEVLGNLEQRRIYHPQWLKKRSARNEPQEPLRASVHRESNSRQEPTRASKYRETDDHHDGRPIRSTTSIFWKVLRWIAVAPAGITVAVLVTFPIHWVLMLFGLILAETIEHIERLIIAFTTPFFIIYVGASIAPTHHKETGIALGIFTALILGGLYVFTFTGSPYLIGWNSLYFGATPVLNLAGIVAGIATALYKMRSR